MHKVRDIQQLAELQHGLVSCRQAADLHHHRESRRHLVASGRWELVTPRVLRLRGYPPDDRQLLMASVLDGGPGTCACRHSACALWRVPGFLHATPVVTRLKDVHGRRPHLGVLREIRDLSPLHTTVVDGIPVTTLPVTLFHLAGCERPERVLNAVNAVCRRTPSVLDALHDLLPELAARGRNGITTMRMILDALPRGSIPFDSALERRFHQILVGAGLPPMARQVNVGGHEWIGRVDFVDWELLLVIEVDSATYHLSPLDKARDATRDEQLLAVGFRGVLRITEEQIWHRPWEVLDVVRAERRRLASGS